MRFTKKKKTISALQSTAMADIIFLLLIFFLLSSSFIIQTGIKVDLPRVTQVQSETEKDIVVTITADESLYLDGIKIPWANLRERLESRLSASRSKTVIVKGDEAIRLGRVVQVMDIARQLGADQMAIAAQPVSDRRQH